jgi:alpha-galactosidase/6-phospho-beta-glucosidase family protein
VLLLLRIHATTEVAEERVRQHGWAGGEMGGRGGLAAGHESMRTIPPRMEVCQWNVT